MNKKLLVLMLLSCTIFSFVACGSNGKENNNNKNTEVVTELETESEIVTETEVNSEDESLCLACGYDLYSEEHMVLFNQQDIFEKSTSELLKAIPEFPNEDYSSIEGLLNVRKLFRNYSWEYDYMNPSLLDLPTDYNNANYGGWYHIFEVGKKVNAEIVALGRNTENLGFVGADVERSNVSDFINGKSDVLEIEYIISTTFNDLSAKDGNYDFFIEDTNIATCKIKATYIRSIEDYNIELLATSFELIP